MATSFLFGLLMSFSLITSIGSQNIFVLNKSIQDRDYVFPICLICVFGDILLFGFGVFGVGNYLAEMMTLQKVLASLGIIFLMCYACKCFYTAFNFNFAINHSTVRNLSKNRNNMFMQTFCITFLNPHVYIDTILIIGGLSVAYDLNEKINFFAGSCLASIIWFSFLGYAGIYARDFLKKRHNYILFNIACGFIMMYATIPLWEMLIL